MSSLKPSTKFALAAAVGGGVLLFVYYRSTSASNAKAKSKDDADSAANWPLDPDDPDKVTPSTVAATAAYAVTHPGAFWHAGIEANTTYSPVNTVYNKIQSMIHGKLSALATNLGQQFDSKLSAAAMSAGDKETLRQQYTDAMNKMVAYLTTTTDVNLIKHGDLKLKAVEAEFEGRLASAAKPPADAAALYSSAMKSLQQQEQLIKSRIVDQRQQDLVLSQVIASEKLIQNDYQSGKWSAISGDVANADQMLTRANMVANEAIQLNSTGKQYADVWLAAGAWQTKGGGADRQIECMKTLMRNSPNPATVDINVIRQKCF